MQVEFKQYHKYKNKEIIQNYFLIFMLIFIKIFILILVNKLFYNFFIKIINV